MPRTPCIKGCIYYRGMDAHRKAICICQHVPKPQNVDPDVGCWWGEREKAERRVDDEDKTQGSLF